MNSVTELTRQKCLGMIKVCDSLPSNTNMSSGACEGHRIISFSWGLVIHFSSDRRKGSPLDLIGSYPSDAEL